MLCISVQRVPVSRQSLGDVIAAISESFSVREDEEPFELLCEECGDTSLVRFLRLCDDCRQFICPICWTEYGRCPICLEEAKAR